jgi:pimeloyl-ACP methyl ester carboxylesterase
MLKTSAPLLTKSAQDRAHREDFGDTAVWRYSSTPDAKRLLLVHGFRGDHHGLEAIAGALPDFEVFIPDLPGYGKTPPFSEEHNLENYGQWLVELYSQLPQDVAVLGHSFGSLVVSKALELGLPTENVILLNPISTRSEDQEDLANKAARWFYRFTEETGAAGSLLLRSPLIVRGMSMVMATSKNLKLRSFIHSQHARFFSSYTSDKVAWEGFRAASGGNVMDYIEHFPLKTLLVAGEVDSIAPLRGQIELKSKLPQARLEVITGVGHLTHYEKPLEVAALVRDFAVSN